MVTHSRKGDFPTVHISQCFSVAKKQETDLVGDVVPQHQVYEKHSREGWGLGNRTIQQSLSLLIENGFQKDPFYVVPDTYLEAVEMLGGTSSWASCVEMKRAW